MAYIAGISGGSGSGKTTFIKKLEEAFLPGELVVLSQDHYYKPAHAQRRDENGQINFDEPESIDLEKFISDIERLEAGKDLYLKEYNFNNPDRPEKTIVLKPAKIIVIEGLFILGIDRLKSKLDVRFFIEADEEIKFQRRLKRDSTERGMTEEEIYNQWNCHVKPSFQKYILPQKEKVDMIIMNNTHFNTGFQIIANHFRLVLNNQ